jgi:hypothetical protein
MQTELKNLVSIIPPYSWAGRRAFILAGGPSLSGFSFDCIKDELTIGVNKSYEAFPTTINYSMDEKFLKLASQTTQWKQYKGHKVNIKLGSNHYHDPDVKYVTRLKEKTLSFDLEKGIYTGNNSGFGAMMLAVCLGANPVYLLGVDLKIQKDKTHWHEGYPKQNIRAVERSCLRFKKCFEEFAPILQKEKIEIYNLNPDSELKCFPFKSIEEVLK